jgi:hypothetical protein
MLPLKSAELALDKFTDLSILNSVGKYSIKAVIKGAKEKSVSNFLKGAIKNITDLHMKVGVEAAQEAAQTYMDTLSVRYSFDNINGDTAYDKLINLAKEKKVDLGSSAIQGAGGAVGFHGIGATKGSYDAYTDIKNEDNAKKYGEKAFKSTDTTKEFNDSLDRMTSSITKLSGEYENNIEHSDEIVNAKTFEDIDNEYFITLNKELRFLSNKEVIYGANVDEDGLLQENDYVKSLKEYAKSVNSEVVVLCAKIEEELIGLEEDEAKEFLEDLGAKESGLEKIIHTAFNKLGLQSYFTAGVVEVRSWTIKKGTKAPQAAAVIHNDFEKGFIKAEVIGYDDFISCGGETKAKEAGKLRIEGKDYIVQDGDVMHFRFNV